MWGCSLPTQEKCQLLLQFLRVGDHAGVSAHIRRTKGPPMGLDFPWSPLPIQEVPPTSHMCSLIFFNKRKNYQKHTKVPHGSYKNI